MGTNRGIISSAVIVLLLSPATTLAQHVPRLDRGATVRITAKNLGLQGDGRTVAGFRSDTLFLTTPVLGDPPVPVPLATIQDCELLVGRRAHTWQGAGIGLISGAALGAVLGAAIAEDGLGGTRGEYIKLSALAGAPVGALVGAIIGSQIRSDRWRPLSRAELGAVSRVSLGLQHRLGGIR